MEEVDPGWQVAPKEAEEQCLDKKRLHRCVRLVGRSIEPTQLGKAYLRNIEIHVRKRKSRPLDSELQAMTPQLKAIGFFVCHGAA